MVLNRAELSVAARGDVAPRGVLRGGCGVVRCSGDEALRSVGVGEDDWMLVCLKSRAVQNIASRRIIKGRSSWHQIFIWSGLVAPD